MQKLVSLLKHFIDHFDKDQSSGAAVLPLEIALENHLKELRDKRYHGLLSTWEAVCPFVLSEFLDLKPHHIWDRLRPALCSMKRALEPTMESEQRQGHLSYLPAELVQQIVAMLDLQDQKEYSLVSKQISAHVLSHLIKRRTIDWALWTLQALGLSMHSIIYELMAFHQRNEQLGSKIIHNFNQTSAEPLEVRIEVLDDDLFKRFLQILAESKSVMIAQELFQG